MATKLHQILAVEKSVKSTTESTIARTYHDAQKSALFAGLSRTYAPLDDDDREMLPPERKNVQLTAADMLTRAATAWTRQADAVATKDQANTRAFADVIVERGAGTDVNVVVLRAVPVTTLLYLEKMLVNVREMIVKLPILDPEVAWTLDPATDMWRSEPEETVRTRKVPKAFVKAPATDKHPAQVDTYTEDVVVGRWTKTLFSGALPAARRNELISRVEELQAAVKMAREYANQADVEPVHVGAAVFEYLLDR